MGADRVRSQWLFLDPLGEENCVPKVFLQSFTDLARFLLETGMIPGVLELSMAPIAFGSQGGQRGARWCWDSRERDRLLYQICLHLGTGLVIT